MLFKVLVLMVLGYFIARSARSMIRAILQDSRRQSGRISRKRQAGLKDPEVEDARWVDIE